jgi:REP element-mobilizing transposase RayT
MPERYRYFNDGAIFFVTFSVVDWLPVFINEATCKIVADSFNFCHEQKGLRVNAYVVMPTHLHAIVFADDFHATKLQNILIDFRKFTGRQLCDYAENHLPQCFSTSFRQASGGDRQRRFWQPTHHPVVIASQPFWQQKLDYTHENPYRKGLVRRAIDWRFSSAGYWLSDGQTANDVLLSAIDW